MSANPNINKVLQLSLEENKIQIFTKYYETGELLLRGKAINGKLNDRGQVFYKNGNIHCDLIYKDNEMHGLCKGHYLHGQLALEVLFNMGKAIYGVYYKKSGFKTIMTPSQLEKKSDSNL